jgi:hypothetical protein
MLPQLLILASAAIVLVLGSIHLVYTFTTSKLLPRDPSLVEHMKRVSPVISKETTIWRAWIGFNASHSLGAILFGVLYGYLAIFQFRVLIHARFLLLIGAVFLASFLVLAKRYWFSIPLAGIAISFVLFVVGVAVGVT